MELRPNIEHQYDVRNSDDEKLPQDVRKHRNVHC